MDRFDVVVIGSGLGGLASALILCKEGFKVCVLEKNRQYGGNLQIFVRDKVIFDTGVHYIGGLDEGQNLHQYFRYFGILDRLKLHRMDPNGYDRITFEGDDNEYPHAMGYENFVDQLLPFFPEEKEGLQQYCKAVRKICNDFPLYNLEAKINTDMNMKWMSLGAKDFIDGFTKNPRLRDVLGGSNALYAGIGDQTPVYSHALVVNSYMESAWKCIDGGSQIARYMVAEIKKLGGTVLNYAKVVRFHASRNAVRSVELEDGRQFEGKNFISNIHPLQTLNMLPDGMVRKVYLNRIRSLRNSISVFTVHLVFKEGTFPYLNHNYYHNNPDRVWDSTVYDREKWPEAYALFVPAGSRQSNFAEGMNVMSYMDYEEVAQWSSTFHTIPRHQNDRGSDYEVFKKLKAERLIDAVEKRFPNIRQCIKSYYTSTPLSFRDYIGTSDGSLYGIQKNYNDPLRSFISPRTRVPNLFLTGQNLNLHGILGVTVSSVVTCSQLTDVTSLVDKIRKA